MKKVLVIFGSMSSEHEISCISAGNVLENIDNKKYIVTKLGIDKSGKWFEYNGEISNIKENKWLEDTNNKVEIKDIISYLSKFDVVFPVLHGKYGEDGTIQGLFELAKVKYVGCKVLGSSIAMDKICSKILANTAGIPVVDYIGLSKLEYDSNEFNIEELKEKISQELSFPVIVKPNKEGSSYGVKKVENENELKEAIEYSLEFDDKILIEKYIGNRKEVECAVIEKDGDIYASTPGEIVSATELYDFDSKYTNKASYTKIPADIKVEYIEKIKEYAKVIFKTLNLNGLSRVDFFVSDDKIYFNEVNTLPGFTSISMYPQMLIHDGISYSNIIEILIENA